MALACGVFFIGIKVMGDVMVGSLELHGSMSALTDVVRDKLMHRYDKAAWAALGAFTVLAVTTYRKDRRRLFGA